MRKAKPLLTLALAAALPASGCATTHLSGEYRTGSSGEVRREHDQRIVAKGSEFLFFWGLLDTGHFNVDNEVKKHVRENEVLTDISIKDRLSVGGFFLWLITGGIVSHHAIVVRGAPAELKKMEPPVKEKERETIIVPQNNAPPAGYERTRPMDGSKTRERETYERETLPDSTPKSDGTRTDTPR